MRIEKSEIKYHLFGIAVGLSVFATAYFAKEYLKGLPVLEQGNFEKSENRLDLK